MKQITAILTLTTLALAAPPLMAAGVPQVINYQARLTDGSGNNVADGVYTTAFKIYDAPAGGTLLWSETLPVQVTDGLLTTLLGTVSAIPADLFSGGADRYLGVAVNPDPEMPRVSLSSVAYAYQAKDADVAMLAQDLNCVGCVSAGEIADGAVDGGLGGPILDGSITSLDLGTNSVGSDEIGSAAVNSSEIATDAVGSAEIATDAVGSAEIATDAVGADEIATDAVTALEIAVDAVGAAEIATGAVGSDAIASSAVGTAEVADGSLTAVDIDDEPGVASNTRSVGDLSLDGTVQTLLSRTITAPAAGYVLVMATAQVNIVHTTGTLSFANFGVTSTTGVFPDNQTVSVQLHVDVPSGTLRQAVTVHGLFSTSGGMDSFYFLGEEILGIFSVGESQLTLIYFPTAHGTVVSTAAAPSSGELSSDRSDETGSGLSDTGSEPVQTQGASSTSIQPDQAQMLADMEARIKQLEESLRQGKSGIEEKR